MNCPLCRVPLKKCGKVKPNNPRFPKEKVSPFTFSIGRITSFDLTPPNYDAHGNAHNAN